MTAEPQPQDEESKQARTWAMLCHLAGISMYVGVPFGNIVGPLVIWLIKKDEYKLVDGRARSPSTSRSPGRSTSRRPSS